MRKPEEFLLEMDGSFYKIGLHRHVFIWREGGWMKSNKDTENLYTSILKNNARLKGQLAKARKDLEELKAKEDESCL